MRIVEQWSNVTVIEVNDALQVLFSYKTPVAAWVAGRGILRTDRSWSVTTSKHINQWIKLFNRPTVTVVPQAEIEALANSPEKQAEVLDG